MYANHSAPIVNIMQVSFVKVYICGGMPCVYSSKIFIFR